jgi:hypothetical protein
MILTKEYHSGRLTPVLIQHGKVNFEFDIQNNVENDFKNKFYHIFGKRLDLIPIWRGCFMDQGMLRFSVPILYLNGTITINNRDKIPISFNETVCYELDPKVSKYDLQYSYTLKTDQTMSTIPKSINELPEQIHIYSSHLDIKIEPINQLEFSIAFLVAWWAVIWLFSRVIVISVKGLELDKK